MTCSWDHAIAELAVSTLNPTRWVHIWGVLETALAIADRHGIDRERTAWAALLHDCAKCMERAELERLLREQGLVEEEDDWRHPQVWHALVGAYLARERFGIRDEGILRAIRLHPTGDADMDGPGMALFVADYTEPSRRYPGSREFRKRALERPLLETALAVCRNKIDHVREKGNAVHRRSLRAVDALERRVRELPVGGECR